MAAYDESLTDSVAADEATAGGFPYDKSASDGLSLNETYVFGWGVSLADDITLDDVLAYLLMISPTLTDDFTLDDATSERLVITTVLTETAALDDTLTPNQVLSIGLTEEIVFTVTLTIDGQTYTGIVLNTESFANTEYDAFNFNSLCEFDGSYFGAKDDGIYELAGDTDDGTYIDAKIVTGILDMEASNLKRLEEAYLGLRNDGSLVLKGVVRQSDGTKAERWYELTRTSASIRTEHIKLGKGIKASHWQFELSNKNGADFELDVLELYPVLLTRKIP